MQHLLAVFLFGFVGGIFFHSFFDFGYWFSLFVLLIGAMLFVYERFATRGSKAAFGIALFLFAAGIGLLRYDISDLSRGDSVLEGHIGQKISLRGVIIEEPDEREDTTRLIVAVEERKEADTWRTGEKTKVLLVVPLFSVYHYGDQIEFTGILKKPANFGNENGREFDYISYLAKDGIFYQMFYPDAEHVSFGHGNPVKRNLFALKNAFLARLGAVIPEPEASLAGGLIVGAKRSLGAELLDAFRTTGIIHIVVLSGYNVTIVAEAIMRVFSFLPRMFGIGLGALSIFSFAVMTGASATIIRASLMALLVILARATGRLYEITIALFFAAFIMLLANPKILVFDPSFQLSFLATLGLIYLAPRIEHYFNLVPSVWGLREFAVATVATQIFVLPLLLYQTGELSLVSLPVNLLILVFVPATMLFGFLTGAIGFVSAFLSLPFAFVSYTLLAYQLKVVELFAALPFASLSLPAFPGWLMILFYGLYGAGMWYFLAVKSRK